MIWKALLLLLVSGLHDFSVTHAWEDPEQQLPPRSTDSYHTIILGGGPAGLGILYHAAIRGELESWLDEGILILERSAYLGSGTLRNFHVQSNSAGTAFIDVFAKSSNASRLFPRSSSSARARAINVTRPVQLAEVAALLEEMAEELQSVVDRHPASRVILRSDVKDLEISSEGLQKVTYRNQFRQLKLAQGRHVIIAMGGYEDFDACLDGGLGLTNLSLHRCGFRSLTGARDTLENVSVLTEDHELVVVGNSHSAWSLLAELERRQWQGHATVISRSQPRYFFYTETEARGAGVDFHALEDVCPLTGRINRFRGLRGSARDLAKQVEDMETIGVHGWIRRIHNGTSDQETTELCQSLADANVVCAAGYRPRWPRIRVNGKLANVDETVNTATAQVVTDQGILKHTYAYGLGAGLRLSADIGGELHAWGRTRADGVWLYMFDVSGLVYNQLFQRTFTRRESWKKIYCKKALSLESASTPLHHFGGYEMFSWDQWYRQVETLMQGVDLESTRTYLEVGVGAGAFASALQGLRPTLSVTGVDLVSEVVQVARQRVVGDFHVAAAEDISQLFEPASFDFVASFGLTTYLESEAVVVRMVRDMLRIARRFVYIGEVSDAAKRESAEAARRSSHVNATNKQSHASNVSATHLYVSKECFTRVAASAGAKVAIVDHDLIGLTYPTASYRYSVYIEK
eukprot:TRINITY_DN12736_c0_g1_i1.p1 TRINITY_DN12736_c0_g1~~TRINITY_DN12736_c0_g1_i1.p1  ORF type:complete len:690 (-),score=110.07 TRINITY_DN12736_c0_g1_i1:143-2212(-)